MIDRLHSKVAQLSENEAKAWSQGNYGTAIGTALAVRVASVALFVLQVATLIVSPFFSLAKIAVFCIRERSNPHFNLLFDNYVKGQIASVKMHAIGLGISGLSILASEVAYNALKLQKALYKFSVTQSVLESNHSDMNKFWSANVTNALQTNIISRAEESQLLSSFYEIWLTKALRANNMSAKGQPNAMRTFKDSQLAAKVAYVTNDRDSRAIPSTARMKAQQLFLMAQLFSNGSRNDEEQECFEILARMYPRQIATLQQNAAAANPGPGGAGAAPAPAAGDDAAAKAADDEASAAAIAAIIAREADEADDARIAAGMQMRDLVRAQRAGVVFAPPRGADDQGYFGDDQGDDGAVVAPSPRDPALAAALAASEAQGKLDAMNRRPPAEVRAEIAFSKRLLESMKQAHKLLVKEGVFTTEDIEGVSGESYCAVQRLGIYLLLSPESRRVPIWQISDTNQAEHDVAGLQAALRAQIATLVSAKDKKDVLTFICKRLSNQEAKLDAASEKLGDKIFEYCEALRCMVDKKLCNTNHVKNAVKWFEAFDPKVIAALKD